MPKTFIFCSLMLLTLSAQAQTVAKQSARLHRLLDNYLDQYARLNPVYATYMGNNRYNDRVENYVSQPYIQTVNMLSQSYLDSLRSFPAGELSASDRITFDCFRYDLTNQLAGLRYPAHITAISQTDGFHIFFAQLGGGDGLQPFKTPQDYTNFLDRINGYVALTDSTIASLQRAIPQGQVHPKVVIRKVIGQLQSFLTDDLTKSIFYRPVTNIPGTFSPEQRATITRQYEQALRQQLIPAYRRLYTYLAQEYLPHCRETVGIGALPGGQEWYQFLIRKHTTTTLKPDEIHQMGLQEVARIRKSFDELKQQLGYQGDVLSFLNAIRTDPKLKPFRTDTAILDRFEQIHQTMQPGLKRLFNRVPNTPFIVRPVEKYLAAATSAYYNPGNPDGSRPGVFYVPITNPADYLAIGMESLFLHEAIPGHHYQISLQKENKGLPLYRQQANFNAFTEGWALYTEGLGKELGLFKDPYQYLGYLQSEMHRAIRLVVDTGIHAKGWSREQAIRYSLDNEAITEARAIQEVERYIASPGQALSYKIGQKYILAARQRAEKALGNRFDIRAFHDHILLDGSLPLELFDRRMDEWITSQR